jgi:hypothetical protein
MMGCGDGRLGIRSLDANYSLGVRVRNTPGLIKQNRRTCCGTIPFLQCRNIAPQLVFHAYLSLVMAPLSPSAL